METLVTVRTLSRICSIEFESIHNKDFSILSPVNGHCLVKIKRSNCIKTFPASDTTMEFTL